MTKFDKKKRKDLLEIYPFKTLEKLEECASDDLVEYKCSIISIYDHLLTEEETSINLLSYACIDKNNKVLLNEFYRIKNMYLDFFLSIYKIEEILWFRTDKKQVFFKFRGINEFKKICIDNIKEKKFMNLIIPNLNLVIIGSFDLNTILYYKKNIDFINGLVENKGLFLIK